jgi:hypothetical protein
LKRQRDAVVVSSYLKKKLFFYLLINTLFLQEVKREPITQPHNETVNDENDVSMSVSEIMEHGANPFTV